MHARTTNVVLLLALLASTGLVPVSCAPLANLGGGTPVPAAATPTPTPTAIHTPPATPRPATFGGVRFQVDAPFSTALLEIAPDGGAVYVATSPDTGIEEHTKTRQLNEDAISILMEAVRQEEFLSLHSSYPYVSGVSYEDGSTYVIEINVAGETKEVACYESECPESFRHVMQVIREIWGEEILEVGV